MRDGRSSITRGEKNFRAEFFPANPPKFFKEEVRWRQGIKVISLTAAAPYEPVDAIANGEDREASASPKVSAKLNDQLTLMAVSELQGAPSR